MTTTKIALVTGGSRGLGKNMALSLAKKGNHVIITYNSKREEALAVIAEIEKAGQKGAALQLNTGDSKSFDAFFKELTAVLKNTFSADHFDFLINNTRVRTHAPFAETPEAHFAILTHIHSKCT